LLGEMDKDDIPIMQDPKKDNALNLNFKEIFDRHKANVKDNG
jgi:hypothetical protein